MDKKAERLFLEKRYNLLSEDPNQTHLRECLAGVFPTAFGASAPKSTLQDIVSPKRVLIDTTKQTILRINSCPDPQASQEPCPENLQNVEMMLSAACGMGPKIELSIFEGRDNSIDHTRTYMSWNFPGGKQPSSCIFLQIIDCMWLRLFPDGKIELCRSNTSQPRNVLDIHSKDFQDKLDLMFPKANGRFKRVSISDDGIAEIVISHTDGSTQILNFPIALPAPNFT